MGSADAQWERRRAIEVYIADFGYNLDVAELKLVLGKHYKWRTVRPAR